MATRKQKRISRKVKKAGEARRAGNTAKANRKTAAANRIRKNNPTGGKRK